MVRRRLAAAALGLLGLAAGAPAIAGEWTCRNEAGAAVLRFEGDIDVGEFDRFRRGWSGCFGSGAAPSYTIELASGGGVVTEALSIARALVDNFKDKPPLLSTRVRRGDYCISACTYLFVAGQRRSVDPAGSFEPHGFSSMSGSPMEHSVRRAAELIVKKQVPVIEALKASRPRWLGRGDFLASGFGRWWSAEPRLAWLKTFHELNPVERFKAVVGLAREQQLLLYRLDAITMVTMPEVERTAALNAFHALFAIQGAQDTIGPMVAAQDRPEVQFGWISDAYLEAFNRYFDATRSGKPLGQLGIGADGLREAQAEHTAGTVRTVNERLGPYLVSRRQDIDIQGFVKLMFSTSILYTRPLTREELCDLNIVNRGCE